MIIENDLKCIQMNQFGRYLIDSISGKTIELLFSTQTLYKPQMLNIKRIVLHNLSAKELPHAYTKVIGVVGRYYIVPKC